MSKKLKVGVVGIGGIATSATGVLPNLHHIADKVELTAVADSVEGRAEAAAKKYGAKTFYNSLDELLASDVDAVINLTPIPAHNETNLKILKAGKHLATEKPFASTMQVADQMLQLARDNKLHVVVSPPNMLYPVRQETRRLIKAGAIGKVAFAKQRTSHAGPHNMVTPFDPSWFYQKGSGPMFDIGVYGVHELTGIFGPAKRIVAFSGITAPTRTVRKGKWKDTEIEVTTDDNTLMMLDFGGATYAVMDATFNLVASRSPRLEIFGHAGTLNMNYNVNELGDSPIDLFRYDAAPGNVDAWMSVNMAGKAAQQAHIDNVRRAILADHLADVVLFGKKNALNLDIAYHGLEIMLRAEESARTGSAIDLSSTFDESALDPEGV